MGRRRAAGIPVAADARPRLSTAGPVRVVRSYLAAVVAAVVAGLGFAVSDAVQSGVCGADAVSCTLGVIVLGGSVSAVLGAMIGGLALGLGWEWIVVQVAAIVWMPTLLDAWGPVAWAVLALSPLVGALVTWTGREGSAARSLAIFGLGGLAIVIALVWTYLLG